MLMGMILCFFLFVLEQVNAAVVPTTSIIQIPTAERIKGNSTGKRKGV